MEPTSPLYGLFLQLRRRGFPLGVDDYAALRQALRLGFGWRSSESLRNLCCSLWAKSRSQREILTALFDQLEIESWDLDQELAAAQIETSERPSELSPSSREPAATTESESVPEAAPIPVMQTSSKLPLIDLTGIDLPLRPFVFSHQFPLTPSDISKQWTHLGGRKAKGILEEVDVDATIELRCRQGFAGAIVQRPREEKTVSRVLLLVDQQGSMAPFEQFVEMVWHTIKRSGYAKSVRPYFFHDEPGAAVEESLLTSISNQPFPVIDDVLDQIAPLASGYIYRDKELLTPIAIEELLESLTSGGSAIFVSDAGAARGQYSLQRLVDTISFLKVLKNKNQSFVWLNPLPSSAWQGSTAEQIARHVPMFTLDRNGLRGALAVLKGHRYPLQKAL